MNSIKTARLFVKLMVKEVPGAKVLLLDRFTKRLLTLVYTQTEVLENDVLLVDMIDQKRRDKLTSISCVIYSTPTPNTIAMIKEELQRPKYEKYFIYFTNHVEEDLLKDLAECDKSNLVKAVKIIYTDYLSPDPSLFVLPLPSCVPLYGGQGINEKTGQNYFDYLAQGIIAGILTMSKKSPKIQYAVESQSCSILAERVYKFLNTDEYQNLFKLTNKTPSQPTSNKNKPLLLILDRRHDPITPLLTQWTYKAMVHENIGKGIRDNVVILKKKKPNVEEDEGESEDESLTEEERKEREKQKYEKHEILFSSMYCEFLNANKDSNWGEVCDSMKRQVEKYKEEMKSKDNLETIEEMKNVLENYSNIKKLNRQTNDHMQIVLKLRNEIKRRNLLNLSKLEQEMVCSLSSVAKHNEHWKLLSRQIFQNSVIRKDDALRLALIYILRYEKNSNLKVHELIDIFRNLESFDESEIELLRKGMLSFGGEKIRRSNELFSEAKGLKGIFTKVKSAIKDVENVFTQHVSLMEKVLESKIENKMNENLYPFIGGMNDYSNSGGMNTGLKRIFVFIIGGATFEEVKAIRELNRKYRKKKFMFMLGSTDILNSRKFIKEIKHFQEKIF